MASFSSAASSLPARGSNEQSSAPAAKPAPWKSLVAGATAGAIEGAATYPFEYAKTMLQFAPEKKSGVVKTPDGVVIPAQSRNPFTLIVTTARTKGISALYVGCSSLIVGTAIKASVRFLAFDSIKGMLVDKNGKLSGARGILAGMGAGVLESVLAVTPFETIKTALIEDGKRPKPHYRGLIHGSVSLFKERGIGGVYRGVAAVTLRQGANSAVRMGSYSWLKGLVQARQSDTNASLGPGTTFGIGAIAGIITVYTTMPFDTIKTRMQSLAAKTEYTSTLDCAKKTFGNEGLKAFWSGSTARLGRLVFSGGIVFTVYEAVIDILKPL